MNTRVAIVLASLTMFSLTACSSSSSIDIEDGWDWRVRSAAASDLGVDFNRFTGELAVSAEDAGTGLSLKGASPEPDAMQVALDAAEQDICERYVDPYGDDPLWSQGVDIITLLHHTTSAAVATDYSDEYIDARNAVNAWVNENGPDLDDFDIFSDEYSEANAERSALFAERFQAEYPGLEAEVEPIMERRLELSVVAMTTEMVRAAQDQYIEACDLDVAGDYEYPSPADLGLKVDEEYGKSVEESNA